MVSHDADAPTRTLAGRYRLGPTLGTGAYAKSFDAIDLEDDSPVVVKMLPSRFGASRTFMTRFNADLQVASGLDHPNIARIKNFGIEQVGTKAYPFVVNEQFAGGSLRGILDRGRHLTASQVLVVGLDVCRGLAYAHSKGLVHGAVTPSNLLFGLDRRVRIADFGISRLLGDIVWSEPGRVDVDVARYASPEHALGLPIEPKSDVYSLALTLVESVTGQVPFAADTSVATLSARLDKLMPVSADLGALASVLERAGRPLLDDRFTAVELGRALVAAAEKMPRPEPIAIVGLGRFGDQTATLPQLGDEARDESMDITGALSVVPAPGSTQASDESTGTDAVIDDPMAALAQLPDATDELARDPLPSIQSMPMPVLLEPSAPPAPVEFTPIEPWREADTGEVPVPGFAAVTSVMGEEGTDWAPEVAPKRRSTAIETVEGDDDVLNINRRSMLMYVLGALAVLAAAAIGIIGYRALSTPSHAVPNLIGTSAAEAANMVAADGWKLDVRHARDDSQPQGNVIRTDPAAGDRLKKGSTLVLVVSDGPTLSALPDVTGLSVDEARADLTSIGLTMREASTIASDTVPVDHVISWSVPEQTGLTAGSQVPKGTTVDVVVSSGTSARAVPNVTGLTVDAARSTMESAGLVIGNVVEEFSETVPAGQVISSDPSQGASLTEGKPVSLTVSKGRDLVVMPTIVGRTLAQATDALTKAGLQVGSVTGPATGTVSWSNITAGTKLSRGSPVAIVLEGPVGPSGPSGATGPTP